MASTSQDNAIKTTARDHIWLVGQSATYFTRTRLPSNQQVMALLFHDHKTLKNTVQQSATVVARDV